MIEKGKLYKLKKIRNFFGKNIDDYYKILEISGDLVYCENQETGERNVINMKYFIDPEFPDDVYSDLTIQENKMNIKKLNERLEKVLADNNLKTTEYIKDETASVLNSLSSLIDPNILNRIEDDRIKKLITDANLQELLSNTRSELIGLFMNIKSILDLQ